jgi:hypothetical protein
MSKVIVSIATLAFSAPADTVAGGIRVTLSTTPPQTAMAAVEDAFKGLQAVFLDVPAGDYGIEAQAVDANGAAIGSPVTTSVTVVPPIPEAPPTVEVQVPASISATVA